MQWAFPLAFPLAFLLAAPASASLGDSFPSYKTCVESCRILRCTQGESDGYWFSVPQDFPWPIRLLWSCKDDCQYECMWETVDIFLDKGWRAPQFHGKWPFVRIAGLQEPASVLFSLLNLAVTLKMVKKFVMEVRIDSPMYIVWLLYAIVSINSWVWSSVFHARDIPFTEVMDYLSAFAMVFYTTYAIGMRLLLNKKKHYSLVYTVFCFVFFMHHAMYLTRSVFDYKYNMVANITSGLITTMMCLFFCYQNWSRLPHTKYLLLLVFVSVSSTVLEISDFPPIWWSLDAHALWHFATPPIPYSLWMFAIEDCKYLRKNSIKW